MLALTSARYLLLGGTQALVSDNRYSGKMTSFQRAALRLKLELEWQRVKEDYAAAGKPFGEGRGLDIWVEYMQLTTVN